MRASAFFAFVRAELSPKPGRIAIACRIAVCCAIVVAIAMYYQIPLVSYMAYIVFLNSREDAAGTIQIGIVATVAVTLAVPFTMLFYLLDAAEPALRIPLMALSVFSGVFLMRTIRLGPVAFFVAFLLVMSQTFIDRITDLETMTRLILWLWVCLMVPIAVTLTVNQIYGVNPATLASDKALSILKALTESLRDPRVALDDSLIDETVELIDLRQRAGLLNRQLKGKLGTDAMLLETLAELLSLTGC